MARLSQFPISKMTVGIEVPNSTVKIVAEQNPSNLYPNTVTAVNKDSINSFLNKNDKTKIFEYNGISYQVGNIKGQGSGSKSVDRYKTEKFKLGVIFALAPIVKTPNTQVRLVTGVPASEARHDFIKKDIADNLLGDYVVTYDGMERKFSITNVIVIAQPVGTLFSEFIDLDGEQKVEPEELNDDYLVLDLGWGSSDLCALSIASGKGIHAYRTIFKGMSNVTASLIEKIDSTYPKSQIERRNLTHYEIDQKLRDSDVLVIGNNEKFDVTEIKKEVYREFANLIKEELDNSEMNFAQYNKIFLTGGGGQVLEHYIREAFNFDPRITLVDLPIMANATGFYVYAQMYFYKLDSLIEKLNEQLLKLKSENSEAYIDFKTKYGNELNLTIKQVKDRLEECKSVYKSLL